MITIGFKYFSCKTSYSFFYDRRLKVQSNCNEVILYKKSISILVNKNVNLARKLNELELNNTNIIYRQTNDIDFQNPILCTKTYNKIDIAEIKAISIIIFRLTNNINKLLKVVKQKLSVQQTNKLSLNIFNLNINRLILLEAIKYVLDKSIELEFIKSENILNKSIEIIFKRVLNNIYVSNILSIERAKSSILPISVKSLNRFEDYITLNELNLLEAPKYYMDFLKTRLIAPKLNNINLEDTKYIKTIIDKICLDKNRYLYKGINNIYKNNSYLISSSTLRDILMAKSIQMFNKLNRLSNAKSYIFNKNIYKGHLNTSNTYIYPLEPKKIKLLYNILFSSINYKAYSSTIYNMFAEIKEGQISFYNKFLTHKIYKIDKYNNLLLYKELNKIYSDLNYKCINIKNDKEIFNEINNLFVYKKLLEIEFNKNILMYKKLSELNLHEYKLLIELLSLEALKYNNYGFLKFNTTFNMLKDSIKYFDLNNVGDIFMPYFNYLKLNETNRFISNDYKNIVFNINNLEALKSIYNIYFSYEYLENSKTIDISNSILMNLDIVSSIYYQNNNLFISKKSELFIHLLHYIYALNKDCSGSIEIYKPQILVDTDYSKDIYFNKNNKHLDLDLKSFINKNVDTFLYYNNIISIIFGSHTYLHLLNTNDLIKPSNIRLSNSTLKYLYQRYISKVLYTLPYYNLIYLNYKTNKLLAFNNDNYMHKEKIIRFNKLRNTLKSIINIVNLYRPEDEMYIKNILLLLESIHKRSIHIDDIKIILKPIEVKLNLLISQIKCLKYITKYKLYKVYSLIFTIEPKVILGYIEKCFYLYNITTLYVYISNINNSLKYINTQEITYANNTLNGELKPTIELFITGLIYKLIFKHSLNSFNENQSIILNLEIISEILKSVANKIFNKDKERNVYKSMGINIVKNPNSLDIEKQELLEKQDFSINKDENLCIDKIFDNIVIDKVFGLNKFKDKIYCERLITNLIKEKPELYIEKDEQSLKMYKRGWFLRSIAPTDLLIVPKEDYPYNDYPAVVEAFYEDWDVYYWHHEKTDSLKKHPIPFGTDLGIEHIEVSIEIIVDMVNIVLMLWSKFYYAFQQFHGVGAIKSMIQVIYNWLMLETSIEEMKTKGSYDDYIKVYRFFRWEAEKMVHKAKSDYSFGGNYWIEKYIEELFDYLLKHHFNKVPLFKCIIKMDFMRDILRDPQGNIDFVLDKIKGMRFYNI